MNNLILVGLILNSGLILFNRYVKHLPNMIYIPLMLLAIGCMLVGAFQAR